MNTLDAMQEVNDYLRAGDHAMAQCAVMSYEAQTSTLPSSVFERVLKASIQANALLPLYAEWCRRAYGSKAYASILASL